MDRISESILLKLGIPESAIEAFGHVLRNTQCPSSGFLIQRGG